MLLLLLLDKNAQPCKSAWARTVRVGLRRCDPVCVCLRITRRVRQQSRLAWPGGGALLAQAFEVEHEPARRRLCAGLTQHVKGRRACSGGVLKTQLLCDLV